MALMDEMNMLRDQLAQAKRRLKHYKHENHRLLEQYEDRDREHRMIVKGKDERIDELTLHILTLSNNDPADLLTTTGLCIKKNCILCRWRLEQV